MRIYCTWCDAHPEHKAICPYQPKKEETVKFEVGDKVSVQGTVTQLWRHNGKPMCDVKVEGGMQPYCIREDSLTLVERPKKFKVGKKYSSRLQPGNEYMFLGNQRWFNYASDEAIYSYQIDVNYLDELDS